MDFNDAIEKIRKNPELAKSLEEALRSNADEKELKGMLADAGFDADAIDDLLAEFQRKRGVAIGFEDLDRNAMKAVAGGTAGDMGACDHLYFLEPCVANVDDWCWSNDSCVFVSNVYSHIKVHDGE